MCLCTVTNIYPNPLPQERLAYKVFRKKDGNLLTSYRDVILPIEKWTTDNKGRTLISDDFPHTDYPTGYHCWATRRGARSDRHDWNAGSETIRKVLVRDIVAEGIQDGNKVIVARKIKVLPGRT